MTITALYAGDFLADQYSMRIRGNPRPGLIACHDRLWVDRT